MKVAGSIKSTGIAIGAVCLHLIAMGVAQAAVVQGRASAEVINPATVDSAGLLAAARAQAEGGPVVAVANSAALQARPEVRVVTVKGVFLLSIDYN